MIRKQDILYKIIGLLSFTCLTLSKIAFAKNESWYWDFDLGFTSTSYTGKMGDIKRKLQNDMHESSGTTSFGLGFYWPTSSSFLVGIRSETVSDRFTKSINVGTVKSSQEANLSQSSTAFTIVKSLGDEDFKGSFLRGEIGLIQHTISSTISIDKTSTTVSDDSSGTAIKAEYGYGFLIGEDTRFVVTGGIMSGKTGFGSSQIVNLNFGFNF